jgi:endonuclease III
MNSPSLKNKVKTLLKDHGRTFSEDLGLSLKSNQPDSLFCLLVASLLFSARISHTAALESARSFIKHGWTTPQKLLKSKWEQRVKVLDEAGYARFDERTSTMLGDTSQLLVDRYHGDLRNLRKEAKKDPLAERNLLKQCKGIGDLGASIFLREAQVAWPENYPFADARVLSSARKFGLPADTRELASLVAGPTAFARLVSALIRVQLES